MNCNYKVKITDIQTKYKFKVFCTGYDDSEIKEKVDAIYQAFPKTTEEGETPTLDNTANATMSIDLKGNTSQETTTGKNLLAYPYYDTTKTINGITFTDNGDGTINANGTASANVSFFLLGKANNQEEIKGNYISGGASYNVKVRAVNLTSGTYTVLGSSEGSPTSLNKSTYSRGYIEIVIVNGTTVNNLTIKPMLTNNEDSDYEPYTNGASPNPDYPQDVHVVTGDNTINITGKNLINTVEYNRGINSSGVISGVDTHYLGIEEFVPCKPSTTYSITFEHDINTLSLYIGYKDKNGNFLNRISTSSRTFTTPNNAYYLFAYVYKDDRFSNAGGYVQLEYGTQTPYEPYQSQSYAVNLGTMELCEIGDYQDYIYKEGKKWYKYGAVGKVVLDGSESWIFRTDWTLTNASVFRNNGYVIDTFITGTNGYSNYFKVMENIPATASPYHYIRVTNTTGYGTQLFIEDSELGITSEDTSSEKASKLKNWLSTHNTIVYGIKPTPEATEITDTTLISQLNALAGAESYSGQTNISQVNNDKPFIITAKALKDLSNL